MARKSLLKRHPFLILGIFFLGWLLLPGIVKSVFRVSIIELQAPSRQAASVVRDIQDYWALRTTSRNALLQDLSDLARLNSYYQLQHQRLRLYEEEIARLERIFDLPPQPEYRFEIARVVQRETNSWWQTMTIRKGRQHGIEEGAPVVFAGGVVGRIQEVHLTTSTVELISSSNLRLSVRFQNDLRPLGYQGGRNRSFAQPRGQVDFVPMDFSYDEDNPPLLLTSGLGGVFPEGLVVGRLASLTDSHETLFQSGEVLLDPRLHKLREVAVLLPIE